MHNLNKVSLIDKRKLLTVYNVNDRYSNNQEECNEDNKIYNLSVLLIEALISNWEGLCQFFFVLYYFANNGLLAMPLIFIVFIFFLINEHHATIRVWNLTFLYVSFLIVFKFFLILFNELNC